LVINSSCGLVPPVSGFRASTSDRVGGNHGSPISTCTMCWHWFACLLARRAFHGRKRELLSESRMLEIARSRSGKQNTHLVTPGQILPAQPIIGLPALLRLVEWYQERRRNTQQGGLLCVNFEPPLSPPAPQQDKSSTKSSADMGDSCRRATGTNHRRADPRRRPATGEASGPEGGDA